MVAEPGPAQLIELLNSALQMADTLKMSIVACHIDHALALAQETAAIGQPAPALPTSSVM